MSYKVTKQYGTGVETPWKEFKLLNEAEAAVKEQLLEDAAMKVKVIYRIKEWDDLIKEFDSSNIDPVELSSSSQGQGAGSRPTPLPTAPRPPGMPQSWVKDEDDKKK